MRRRESTDTASWDLARSSLKALMTPLILLPGQDHSPSLDNAERALASKVLLDAVQCLAGKGHYFGNRIESMRRNEQRRARTWFRNPDQCSPINLRMIADVLGRSVADLQRLAFASALPRCHVCTQPAETSRSRYCSEACRRTSRQRSVAARPPDERKRIWARDPDILRRAALDAWKNRSPKERARRIRLLQAGSVTYYLNTPREVITTRCKEVFAASPKRHTEEFRRNQLNNAALHNQRTWERMCAEAVVILDSRLTFCGNKTKVRAVTDMIAAMAEHASPDHVATSIGVPRRRLASYLRWAKAQVEAARPTAAAQEADVVPLAAAGSYGN